MTPKKRLTTFEIAKTCAVTNRTVLNWIKNGKLKSHVTPGNHNRIDYSDFKEFLKKYDIAINDGLLSTKPAKKRVLIVEDDIDLARVLRFRLEKENYEVDYAKDGFQAGKKFVEFKPHLILLDLLLPFMDGYQVCLDLRRDPNNQDIKIIVVSGKVDANAEKRMFEAGVQEFIKKPFETAYLLSKIGKLLKTQKIVALNT